MKFPEVSYLQGAVIQALGADKLTGRELRERLATGGIKRSGPAFYQLMARMEEDEFVAGEYSQKIVEGQIIKERVYKVTAHGRHSFAAMLRFVETLQANPFQQPGYA